MLYSLFIRLVCGCLALLFLVHTPHALAQTCDASPKYEDFHFAPFLIQPHKSFDPQQFITVIDVNITSTQNRIFETTNLSPQGSDTYMLLVDAVSGAIVCQNDDGGTAPHSSRMIIGPDPDKCTAPVGLYKLVILSYESETAGTCDLLIDNNKFNHRPLPFGGRFWRTPLREGEVLQAVNRSLKGDRGLDTVMLVSRTPYTSAREYVGFDDDSGLERNPKFQNVPDTASGFVVIGRYYSPPHLVRVPFPNLVPPVPNLMWIGYAGGSVRVYRNDSREEYHPTQTQCPSDGDCDGLGDCLEIALGTCPFVGHPNCTMTYDPKDTDGDGLPDSWEILGRQVLIDLPNRFPPPFVFTLTFDMELPRFGADALQKDLFFEIDRIPKQTFLSGLQLQELIRGFAVGPAGSQGLRNPNGKDGIRLHFDVKDLPATAYTYKGTESSYGDWGGSNVFPQNGKCYEGATMNEARIGIWRLIARTTQDSSRWGDVVCSRSDRMEFLAHEMGHHLGLSHRGDPDSPIDFNCLAHYDSVMNNAFNHAEDSIRFSKGQYIPLNPFRLSEKRLGLRSSLSEPIDYLYLQNSPYNFQIDTSPNSPTYGAINWNRDQFYEAETTRPIPAPITPVDKTFVHPNDPANPKNGGFIVCMNREDAVIDGYNDKVPTAYLSESFRPPELEQANLGGTTLAALDDRIYLVTIGKNAKLEPQRNIIISKRSTSQLPPPTGTWTSVPNPPLSGALHSPPNIIATPSAASIDVNQEPRLYIFYRKNDGNNNGLIYFFYMKLVNNAETFSTPEPLLDDNGSPLYAKYDVSLFSDLNVITVYFVDTNDFLYSKTFSNQNGTWQWSAKKQETDLSQRALTADVATPTIVSAYNGAIYLFSPRSNSDVLLYRKNSVNSTWGKLTLPGPAINARERLSAANIHNSHSERGVHVWYKETGSGHLIRHVYRLDVSSLNLSFRRYEVVALKPDAAIINGTPSIFQLNPYPYGIRAAYSKGSEVHYLPFADGIIDRNIRPHNDWASIAPRLCDGIASNKGRWVNGADNVICEKK